jgi:hypothetical protein
MSQQSKFLGRGFDSKNLKSLAAAHGSDATIKRTTKANKLKLRASVRINVSCCSRDDKITTQNERRPAEVFVARHLKAGPTKTTSRSYRYGYGRNFEKIAIFSGIISIIRACEAEGCLIRRLGDNSRRQHKSVVQGYLSIQRKLPSPRPSAKIKIERTAVPHG